ncbi:MAG: HD domain-containing phosphohydrolase [Terriglobia bacterium]
MPNGPPIPEAVLAVVERDGTRRLVRVTQSPFLIGRGAESGNHLQLADKRISRRCAALVYADGVFRLEDRGQHQGVFVNGEKIAVRPLRDGDMINFGVADSVQLIFHAGQPQESFPQLLSRLEGASALEPGARDLRQLSLLLEATALLQSYLPLEDLLGAMVDRAIAITGAERGLLLEGREAGLRPRLARRRSGQRLSAESFTPSQTAIAQALARRRGVVEEDLVQAEAALREAHSIVSQQLRSVIAIPLLSLARVRATYATYVSAPGDVLGVLYLDSRRPAAFSGLERQILDALGVEAASVLANAQLLQKDRERRRLQQGTLEALVAALDAREHETYAHSFRVCTYTTHLACLIDYSPALLPQLEHAALLHDIGKVAVPDAILLKPAKLTAEEWVEMRKHPMAGYQILTCIPFLQPAAVIVRHHQERFDGTGYPDGLAGEEIPLGARLFAFADTLDAITSDRFYRKAAEFATVQKEIRRCTGTQFDPRIAEIFCQVPEETWNELRARAERRIEAIEKPG